MIKKPLTHCVESKGDDFANKLSPYMAGAQQHGKQGSGILNRFEASWPPINAISVESLMSAIRLAKMSASVLALGLVWGTAIADEEARTELRLSRFGLLSRRDPIRSPELGPIADRGLPCQGPALAPTTLFYFLQLETSADSQQAKAVLEVWSRYRDRVRLCVLHAPSTPSARRTSELLAQVAGVDERLFFRVLADFVELMRGRYFIRRDDLVNLLRRRGELGRVEATGVRGMIQLGADLDQIRRLGLRAESQVVLGGRQLGYWNVEILDAAIQKETRRGLLAKLRSRTAVLVGK